MHKVTGVRAKPGGRVTLHFGPAAYRVEPHVGFFDWLMEDGPVIVAAIGAAGFGAGAAYAYGAGLTVLAVALGVVAVVLAVVVVLRLLGEALAELIVYAMLALIVLCLPLLLIPHFRRWARARCCPNEPRTVVRDVVFAWAIAHALIRRDADRVRVVVTLTDGATARYTASGEDGARLEHGFRTLLPDRTTVSTH